MIYIDDYRVTKCQKKAPPPEVQNTWKALNYYDNFYINFTNNVSTEQSVEIGGNVSVSSNVFLGFPVASFTNLVASITINGNTYSNTFPLGVSTTADLLNWLNGLSISNLNGNVYQWSFSTNGINNIYTCNISQGNILGILNIFYFPFIDEQLTPTTSIIVLENDNVTITINETENLTTFISTQGQYNYDVRYVLVQANTPDQVIQPIQYTILDADGTFIKRTFELTKDIRQISETSLLYPVKFMMNVRNKIYVNMLPNQTMRMTFYYMPNEYTCVQQKTSGIEDLYLPAFRKRRTMYDNKMLYPNERLRY